MMALTLIRLAPNLAGLADWLRDSGQGRLMQDTGYAVHAALRASLQDLAPQPFCLRQRDEADELLGYVAAPAEVVAAAAKAAVGTVPKAAGALGLATPSLRAMPLDWRQGECFSFELRVVPVIRSRLVTPGRAVEIDAARHPPLIEAGCERPGGAHAAWLAAELGRDSAAELQGCMPVALRQLRAWRRAQGAPGQRRGVVAWLPDLTVRGSLRVTDGVAFGRLLARGVGRHRAFGFGCLLLAAPGVLHGKG